MIYLDSCAAIKLLVAEPESAALVDWLSGRESEVVMSSGLLRVELHRALHRIGAAADVVKQADQLLDGLHLRPIDAVLRDAARLDGQHLRSLDAIHLATALSSASAPTFVTYDTKLARHAHQAGLRVAAPGAPTAALPSEG
ncbi:type II toxin-antitoxin system VapC family toxin [Saccharopolyspora sp. K220]|uniref:type II toxin-antitoxin system VapC family toxin n=1 Tax=Saccharopolyspora soli TaxID=2926618 RepID=UPI001F55E80B|nr:type II toxin-antitoxin system VapC family toxin [Saccharopolyspora soli]MCI2421116.1 type II toxin-antitoxin system VapC family toxin [Saccharopolyspora soli]